uniref:Fetuin B n=1 Tax=Xenopus tropicalis TaxID=8364 RepID=A0A1B8Y3L2_XENTR
MERLCILVLCVLVPLCRAESPLSPVVTPIDCNATEFEAGVALDLINEDRSNGFVFKPLHVVEVHEQEVFGQCKAIILLSMARRVQKLLNYNCTTASVPARVILRTCPDCPTPTWEITSKTRKMADKLLGDFNKESSSTRHFRSDHIERETSQRVGFCEGSIMTNSRTGEEHKQVTCEVYEPKVDRSPAASFRGSFTYVGKVKVRFRDEGQEESGAAGKAYDEPHPSQNGIKPDHPPKDSSHKDHSGSSEEYGEKKPSVRKPKGLVQNFRLNDSDVLPAPAIAISIPPLPTRPEVRPEFIEFPETDPHLPTCPWTKEDKPEILQYLPRKHNQVSADV